MLALFASTRYKFWLCERMYKVFPHPPSSQFFLAGRVMLSSYQLYRMEFAVWGVKGRKQMNLWYVGYKWGDSVLSSLLTFFSLPEFLSLFLPGTFSSFSIVIHIQEEQMMSQNISTIWECGSPKCSPRNHQQKVFEECVLLGNSHCVEWLLGWILYYSYVKTCPEHIHMRNA